MEQEIISDNMKCPYCGYENDDLWDWRPGGYWEGSEVVDCLDCGKPFNASRVQPSEYYITSKLEEECAKPSPKRVR